MPLHPPAPLISVVIPTCHRATWLRRAVASVQAQTYPTLEIIVVDDHSADATPEAVAAIEEPRLRYFRHETGRGASAARNTGIRAARGAFIGFLDDDDEWWPEKLEKQYAVFQAASAPLGLVYSGACKVSDRSGRVISTDVPHRVFGFVDFLKSTRFSTSAALIRASCFDAVGLFDETLPGTQDRDLWLRLARQYAFDFVPEVLVTHHIHGDQITTQLETKIAAREAILDKYRDDLGRHPALLADHLWRLGMLCTVAGRRVAGWRYLARALRFQPAQVELYRDLLRAVATPRRYRDAILNERLTTIDGIALYY